MNKDAQNSFKHLICKAKLLTVALMLSFNFCEAFAVNSELKDYDHVLQGQKMISWLIENHQKDSWQVIPDTQYGYIDSSQFLTINSFNSMDKFCSFFSGDKEKLKLCQGSSYYGGTQEIKSHLFEFWHEIIKNLDEIQKDQLFRVLAKQKYHPYGLISIASKLPSPIYFDLYLEDSDILLALKSLPKLLENKILIYDGRLQDYNYKDHDEISKIVYIIAAAVSSDKNKLKRIFLTLTPDEQKAFQSVESSLSENSKTQILELIAHSLVWQYIYHLRMYNMKLILGKVHLKNHILRALLKIFNGDLNKHESLSRLNSFYAERAKNESWSGLFCVDGSTATNKNNYKTFKNILIEGSGINYRKWVGSFFKIWFPRDLELFEPNSMGFFCENKRHSLSIKKTEVVKFSHPEPYDLFSASGNRNIKVLVPISLVNDIGKEEVDEFKKALSDHLGFEVEDRGFVETLPIFKREFIVNDMLFPVGHNFSPNYFNVSSKQSLYLIAKKKVSSSRGARVVEVHIFLPKKFKFINDAVLTAEEVKSLLRQRSDKVSHSQVIINISCSSAGVVETWNNFFAEAMIYKSKNDVDFKLNKVNNFPHVFGSKSSFNSNSLAELFSSAVYPLLTIDKLALGATPLEINELLKVAHDSGFANMINLISGGKVKSTAFDPLYNFSEGEAYDYGAKKYIFK